MENHYKSINEKNWNRAMRCMVFRDSVESAFCVTFEAAGQLGEKPQSFFAQR